MEKMTSTRKAVERPLPSHWLTMSTSGVAEDAILL